MVENDIEKDLDLAQRSLESLLKGRSDSGNVGRLRVLEEISYPYSRIRRIEFRLHKDVQHYYLKRIVPGSGTLERARAQLTREGELLKQVNLRMKAEVVPLIAICLDQTSIATAQCDGVQFDHLISALKKKWYSRQYWTFLINGSFNCGRWLRKFHDVTISSSQDLNEWMEYQRGEIQWRIRSLGEIKVGHEALFQKCGTKLQKEFLQMPTSIQGCQIHGDYAPHNIFLTADGKIQVLDFYATRWAHPIADVVNYVGKMASMAEASWFPNSFSRKMCESFLKGYGAMREDVTRLFSALVVLQCVKRLLVLYQEAGNPQRCFIVTSGRMDWYLSFLEDYLTLRDLDDLKGRSPWPFLNPLSYETNGES